MNFFGHAAVARWAFAQPEVLFGAMLPDFVGMIGALPPKILSPLLRAGVDHHHRTDDVFHRARTFRQLSGTAARHLQSFGLRRGSALAVAHVGVELLIDCTLGQDPVVCDDYLAAIHAGAPDRLHGGLEWATLEERHRFDRLREVLIDRGLTVTHPAPDRLARRLQRVLAGRPRLELADADCRVVEDWARGSYGVVSTAVPTLLGELHAELDRAATSEAAQ
jgi:hypothetical protein